MNEALAYVVAQRMERTAAALRKNNMEAYCVKTADEVVPLVKTLLAEGATVGAPFAPWRPAPVRISPG